MDPRGGAPGGRRRLGEMLIAGKVLDEAQLEEALRTQREDRGRRRRLGEVITALGFAGEVQIARALSDQLGLPFLDLGSMPIADETLAVLPRNVALRHGAVPVTLAHDVLTVALADPTTCSPSTTSAWPPSWPRSGRPWPPPPTSRRRSTATTAGRRPAGSATPSGSWPTWRGWRRARRVRYRIDGLLREVTVVPKPIQGPLISRVKILSGMDISERAPRRSAG